MRALDGCVQPFIYGLNTFSYIVKIQFPHAFTISNLVNQTTRREYTVVLCLNVETTNHNTPEA